MGNRHAIAVLFLVLVWAAAVQAAGVKSSPHNLAASEGGDACGFCHTPHSTVLKTPQWNPELSTVVYKIYQSSSLQAKPGQPTGASKLCLSCHDGTVAPTQRRGIMSGGAYMVPGEVNLGTDLSDDHPISFVYGDDLSNKDRQIRLASSIPEDLKLDKDGELQCTTCHSAHDNRYGDFLVMPNRRSQMCMSCHDMKGWIGSEHENSNESVWGSYDLYLREAPHQMVSDNGCLCCHRPHSAGGSERLLHFEHSEQNCLNCHDGSVARMNVAADIRRSSGHDVTAYRGIHDPTESPMASARHVECVDCHNPHAVQGRSAQAPIVQGEMQKVSGVTASGSLTEEARYEYEVCFKCHADNPSRVESRITREITQTNTRLEFDPSSPSFHPVVSPGVNKNVPSLRSPLSISSVIYCTDCHNSGPGSAVRGPHGSSHYPLLAYNYSTADFTTESEYAYELCYRCHSRNSIMSNESFPKHREHIEERVPCSACHDAHGISSAQGSDSNNTHLINFDTTIVRRELNTGRREFTDMGIYRGECYLTCHGKNHSPESY